MIDDRELLQRAAERFAPAPGIAERVYRRRERRRTRRRITSGIVAAIVAIAGVATAIGALRGIGGETPVAPPSRGWVQVFGTDGYDSSTGVAVQGGTVFVSGYGHAATLSAFDARTGRVLWERRVGRQSYAVATGASGVYTATWGIEGRGEHLTLVKRTLEGAWVWSRPLGVRGYVMDVETFGGRVFLLGRSFPNWKRGEPRGQDTFVVSYDADGHRAWFTTLGHPFAGLKDLAVDRSGMLGVYAAGPTGHRASLWHLDLDGRLHDEFSDQPIRSIDAVSASDGVVYIGGPREIPGRPASVRAVSPGGRTLWTATIGPERHAPKVEVRVASGDLIAARLGASVDVLLATPDGVIVAGTRAFTFVGSSTRWVGWENVGPGDAYVRMYGRDGRLLWQRVLGDSGRVFVSGIASDGDALYLSGWTDGAFPGHPALGRGDAFVARIPIPGEP